MPNYMSQTFSSPKTEEVTYYRKQSQPHVGHLELECFMRDAKREYAKTYCISEEDIEEGKAKSCQGIPAFVKFEEI